MKRMHYKKETGISQFMVLLEQQVELGSQVITLAGPLFMLLLALLFTHCIINALSRYISQQVQ
jgi:hypothetical protein